jgi:hypothetical protein
VSQSIDAAEAFIEKIDSVYVKFVFLGRMLFSVLMLVILGVMVKYY